MKKLTEAQVDALVDRLLKRVQDANTYFLEQIGNKIKKIGELTPSKAHELVQILKYGGNYEEMVKELSRITEKNAKEIDTIFSEYAKKDQMFYKQFYDYRNVPFTEYANNPALKIQTQALANVVKNEFYNFTRDNVLGFSYKDLDGNVTFSGLRETYNDLLDRALMNVGQGKQTFDMAMRDILTDIGGSGLRTLDYESGRSIRLDSAVRMQLKSKLRELHNENQRLFGQEFGADGVEISVHSNPAPDHEDAQGRQFTNEEFNKLQEYGTAKDIKGRVIDMHRVLKSGDTADDFRPISEMNCYHYIFVVVLGVNEPDYSDEQLEEIKKKNEEGFEYKGKHYTNYQGTQMQRRLETEIRKQKDIANIGRASDNKEIVLDANKRIKALRTEYNALSEASGIQGKPKRMQVSNFRAVKTDTGSVEIKTELPPVIETAPDKVEILPNKLETKSKIFAHSKQWLDLDDPDNARIYNGVNSLKLKTYERKNIKKAYYFKNVRDKQGELQLTGVDTSNLENKEPTATLWHELGHAIDNNNLDTYASNNKGIRMSMFDYYKENPDVPQKVKDYFTETRDRINNDLTNEYKSKFNEQEFIETGINKLKNDEFFKGRTEEQLRDYVQTSYNYDMDKYVRLHRYDNMEYAQLSNLSDMFSAISGGKYDWCGRYGYHSTKYFNLAPSNPTTELFADFTSLKMTGMKDQLKLFKEVAPEIYDELDKLYKELGVKLSAKRINK